MSGGAARRLAIVIVRLTTILLPRSQGSWSRAMINEVAELDDDAEALRFAMGCLWAAVVQAAAHHFSSSDSKARGTGNHHQTEARSMEQFRMRDPQAIGLACAAGAVGLGLVYLAAAQAPSVYIVVNGAAFVMGLIACAALMRWGWGTTRSGAIVLALAAVLVATALFGASADGATRWVRVGSLGVQVSLLFLPLMIVTFARHRDAAGTAGLIVAALAMALQPDRAMAGVLAASLLTLAILRFDIRVGMALVAAVIGFAVTLVRPDTSQASPWVDGVLFTSFEVHPLVGAAVLTGAFLLIVPAVYGFRKSSAHQHAYAVFGTIWIGVIVAAALGNYPTPLVGYGGSAVLGYLLSLASIAPLAASRGGGEAPSGERPHGPDTVRGSLRAA
jgi:cell division protein FtsW (lipid II flippase)